MKFYKKGLVTILLGMSLMSVDSSACTRVVHSFKNGDVVTGRSMDWFERFETSIWKFPRGIQRDGLTQNNPAKWTSKYGSVVVVQTSFGQNASTDGINEKGLVANMLYLTETQYAPRDTKKEGIASSEYIQFLLDNFATVREAVKYIKSDKAQIVPVPIPNSKHLPTMHISISDASGDSAIIEFLDNKVVIHHSKEYKVMTNSPTFDRQLALSAYWDEIGGHKFLPGTRNSADRFVRAKFYNEHLPEAKNYREAIASVMSVIRNASSPFGEPDPDKPNISSTLWRTVADQTHLVYYFESTVSPNLVWVNLKKLDFSKGSSSEYIDIKEDSDFVGNINKLLKKSKAIDFAKVPAK